MVIELEELLIIAAIAKDIPRPNNIETAENHQKRPILITKGYSRDHQPDLKQCVLDLIVSSDSGIPLFMRTGDGNESDKAVRRSNFK